MCVSILLPFYNTKIEYIKECLLSIKNQTIIEKLEIIIVNDGSEKTITKQITEFIKKCNTTNRIFKIYNLHKNYGLPYALNFGLEKCSYKYVARMDSDDIMKLDRIEKQYNFMLENNDCVVLGGQCEIMDEKTKKIKYTTSHPIIITKKYLKSCIKYNKFWFMNHPTVMYKKDIIVKCGSYNQKLIGHSEDTYLWINIIKNGYHLNNLKDVILTYRDCPNSLSHNFKHDIKKDIKKWVKNL